MYALITGASSGIGMQMARLLAKKKYNLLLVARRRDKLIELENDLKKDGIEVLIYEYDLSVEDNLKLLYDDVKDFDIDVLINNAGFGKIGLLNELKYEDGIQMINTNIRAVYGLTHLFINKVSSHILNVGSLASFMPGPKMANYYATKAYVLSFSRAVNYELKKNKKKLRVSCLCPGPVKTEFNAVAKGSFKVRGISKEKCAKMGIKKMFKNKEVIYTTCGVRFIAFMCKFVPHKFVEKISYNMQDKK